MTEMQSPRSCLAILLAAGEGTRMRSQRPKVLHEVGGRSLLGHALSALSTAGADRIVVVVGPDRPEVGLAAQALLPSVEIAVQAERKGTAHAVLAAREALAAGYDDVVVAFADTPLVRPETFTALRGALAGGAKVVALGFEARDPTGYGRLVVCESGLEAIVEHKDATEAQRAITLCNAGLMALDGREALALLGAIGNSNAQGEFYLPDAVAVARARGLATATVLAPESEVQGVNDRIQLAAAEAEFQRGKRRAVMAAGATLTAPDTVFFSHDTQVGRDVTIEPHVVFGPGVSLADGAVIHAFSHLARRQRGALRAPAARRQARREGQGREFRGDQGRRDRGGRQGQPPHLYRRCHGWRRRQYRGGNDHLQLRRILQVSHHHRRGCLRGLEFLAGRPRDDRCGRDRGFRLGRDGGCRRRCPGAWPGAPDRQGGLGKELPRSRPSAQGSCQKALKNHHLRKPAFIVRHLE